MLTARRHSKRQSNVVVFFWGGGERQRLYNSRVPYSGFLNLNHVEFVTSAEKEADYHRRKRRGRVIRRIDRCLHSAFAIGNFLETEQR